MTTPREDPDQIDPTQQSGRPFQVMALFGLIAVGLIAMLIVGIVVL
ncbi:hypothetical protein [Nocardioides campestrisoli]|nr:hypothetical protein [Nocardioides campestrisoli]